MATLNDYRQLTETLLLEYTKVPYAYMDVQTHAVFDRQHDHYLLVNLGWDNDRRVYSGLVHIDIINDQLWIQQDNTEDGIAPELVKAGIPKEHIVLAFQPTEVRLQTTYGVS